LVNTGRQQLPESKEKLKKDAYEKSLAAFSQAIKVFRKEDFVKAKELFETFLEKHPGEKELVDRAKIYLSISENRLSKESIQLETFEDYYQYAVYKVNQEDYDQALRLLMKAREKEPKQGKIPYVMSLVYCQMGNLEKCLEALKDAVHLDKFYGILAQNETSFESIWEDKKFKVITKLA
jgi:tetratricopeptide (TPR) repeat protein